MRSQVWNSYLVILCSNLAFRSKIDNQLLSKRHLVKKMSLFRADFWNLVDFHFSHFVHFFLFSFYSKVIEKCSEMLNKML